MWELLPPFPASSAALLEELKRVRRGELDEWAPRRASPALQRWSWSRIKAIPAGGKIHSGQICLSKRPPCC